MELEVRLVGGIETCFVSLPLSLIHTLQSGGYLPPILALELRSSDARAWHVAWCGSASSSSSSSIEIARQYAECIGLSDRTVVKVRVVRDLTKASMVTIEPETEDDWEVLELNSELAESAILKQVGIVHEGMRFPLWLHGKTVVTFLVMSAFPQKPVVQLVPGAEVAVAPKRRKSASAQSQQQAQEITKVLLRVQDLDSRFILKCDDNGFKMDVVFTAGAFIHPETAKKYSFNSLQSVVISPRSFSNGSKKKLHAKISAFEKEASKGNHSDEQDCNLVVVHILLSESVARGHIMLSQSLRLYLGAGLHSWVHVKTCNVSSKKDIASLSFSPCYFKMFDKKEVNEKNDLEGVNYHENHKAKDLFQDSNSEMGISDWTVHEKIFSALTSISSHDGSEDTATKTGETPVKVGYKNGLSTLLRAWYLAQLDTLVANGIENASSLVVGSKTLLHLKVKNGKMLRNGKMQRTNNKFPITKNQAEEPSVDVLYVLSLSEESMDDTNVNAYELSIDKSGRDDIHSKSPDMLLEKLQLGDTLSFNAVHEISPDIVDIGVSDLDWMGTAPIDVDYSRYFLT